MLGAGKVSLSILLLILLLILLGELPLNLANDAGVVLALGLSRESLLSATIEDDI